MTREEAIEYLNTLYMALAVFPNQQISLGNVDKIKESVGMAIEALVAERWIPVSERLPKDRREVLVTAYWHETYQVMMASYFGDGLWWCVPFNNCGEHMQRLKPKAWMPLPEPYKAESEDKE